MKGRPAAGGERNLPDALLHAAEAKLLGKSHLDLTSREIAEQAGTHAAMVNYYFQSKDGLLSALVDIIVDAGDKQLRELETNITTLPCDPTEAIVRSLVAAYDPHAAIASIIFIEVFRPESSIRDLYARQRRGPIFKRLIDILQGLIDRGIYRADLDAKALAWMLFSLLVGPTLLNALSRANEGEAYIQPTDERIAQIARVIRTEAQATTISE